MRRTDKSFVAGASAGRGPCAGLFIRFTCLTRRNTENPTIRKPMTSLMNCPYAMTGIPFVLASASDAGASFDLIEHEEQAREVDAAEQQTDRRHDDAFDQRGDDLAERGADDDADGQIDDVAPGDEVAKFC